MVGSPQNTMERAREPRSLRLPVGQGIGASVRPHRITSPRSSQKASSPYLKTGVLYGPNSSLKRSSSLMGRQGQGKCDRKNRPALSAMGRAIVKEIPALLRFVSCGVTVSRWREDRREHGDGFALVETGVLVCVRRGARGCYHPL